MRYIAEVNGIFRVHEYPLCLIDAVKSISESLLLAGIDTGNVVRFAGHNFGTIIGPEWNNLNLDLSKGDWPSVG